jgi:hypothetical protein
MQISRRNFLQTTCAALTLAVSSGGLRVLGQQTSPDLFPIPAEVYSEAIFSLTARQAESLVGTTFNVTVAGGRNVRLTLTEVHPLERQMNTIEGYYGESFSLIFESQQRTKLNQGIYRVSGGGLDMSSLLLVPTGIERNKYEVLVNHVTR